MLIFKFLIGLVSRGSITSMAYVALLIPPLISLTGCTGEGAGGPVISSLSTPTDATAESDSNQDSSSEDVNHGDGEEDPIITMTSTPTGVTARVTWDRPTDIDVVRYSVYYGKHSEETPSLEESNSEDSGAEELGSEELNSCVRGESQAVESPSATITGLEPNTPYFFAIRAFNENESESLCSNEIIAVTPPAQS
ncbi:MAG: fibronectin type III domain-containing protein [Nitrospira sp.]|nr:fibronectin type III domain-containing protein [Nitrospira sp.]